jgi:hypothetical protein
MAGAYVQSLCAEFSGDSLPLSFWPAAPRRCQLRPALRILLSIRLTNPAISREIRDLHKEMSSEFGVLSRVVAGLLGPVLLWTSRREQNRLAGGKTYEPKTFIEHSNWVQA